MAKEKRRQTKPPRDKRREPVAPPEDDADELEEEGGESHMRPDDFELELASAEMEAGGAGGRLYVTKLEPREEAGACDSYLASEFTLERLRADYGAGKYLLLLRDSLGTIRRRGKIQLARQAVKPSTAAVDVDRVRGQAIEDYQRQTAPLLELNKTVIAALAGRPASPAFDPLQLLGIIKDLRELVTPPRERSGELDAVMKGVKLANELRGTGGAEGAGIADVMTEWLRTWRVTRGLESESQPAAARELPPPAGPVNEEEAVSNFVQQLLVKQIGVFLKGAEKETDPGVYAQLLLDQVPEQFWPLIAERLNQPDWFEQIFKIDPRIGPQRPWFTGLREQFLAAISPEQPPSS